MSLRNGVSAGLRLIRHDLGGVMKAMDGATASTKRFGKAMTATGAIGVAAGLGVLDVYEKIIRKGDLMQQQLANMRAAGVRQAQIAQNSAASFGASTSLFNVTPQHAASTLMMLRSMYGNSPEARAALVPVLKAEVGINSATGGKVGSGLMQALKALDITGSAIRGGHMSVPALLKNLPYISQAMIQTHGMLTGAEIKRMIQQAGPAATATSFKNIIKDTTEAVMSLGPATGRGMYMTYKLLSAGQANALQALTMVNLGLLPASAVHKVKGSFYRIIDTDKIYADKFLKEKGAIAWLHDKLLPKLASEGITGKQDVIQQLTRILPSSTGARLASFLVNNWPQIIRSRAMIQNGVDNGHPYQAAQTKWSGAISNFSKAWSGLMTALGQPSVKSSTAALNSVSNSIHHMTEWVSKNPRGARGIGYLLLGIGTGLTTLGAIALSAGVVALVGTGGLLVGLAAGVGVVGAAMAAWNWKSLTAGISSAVNALGNLIKSVLGVLHIGGGPRPGTHAITYGNVLNPFAHQSMLRQPMRHSSMDYPLPPPSARGASGGSTGVHITNWGDGSRAIKTGLASGLSSNQSGMTGFNSRLTPPGTPAYSQ